MEDLIIAQVGGKAFPVGNGRQVARRADGVWFLAYDELTRGEGSIALRTSRAANPTTEEDLNQAVVLAGMQETAVLSKLVSGEADQMSILVDRSDTLHAVWRRRRSGDLWYAQCSVGGPDYDARLREPECWFQADGRTMGPEQISEGGLGPASLGDIALGGEDRLCLAYHQGGDPKTVRFATYDKEWRRHSFETGWDSRDPNLDVEEDGTVHVVFGPAPHYKLAAWSEDPFGVLERTAVYHSQSADGGLTWTHADGETHGFERVGVSGNRPKVLASQGRIWVAFGAGGSWEPVETRHFREGPILHYSYYDGHEWESNVYCSPTDPDLSVSPSLFLDCYGQPRLYYVKLNRHHTYMCRWMGTGWSKPQESRWADELSPFATVEKRMPLGAEAFGLMLMAAVPAGEVMFCRVEVPRIRAEPGERILFLDLWELGAMHHLEVRVNTAKKDPHNPVLKTGDPGEWDSATAIAYGSILIEDGVYRMWYQGSNQRVTFGGVGYATSKDGIHWEKPKLGLFEYNGSNENNICVMSRDPALPEELIRTSWGGASCTEPSVYKDLRDPNPQRRYKLMIHRWHHNGAMFVSPDGIHWQDWPSTPFEPPHNPWLEQAGSLFYDEREPNPEHRWKVYGQGRFHRDPSVGGRHGALASSPDCIHWTVYPRPVLDPHGGIEGNRPIRQKEASKANDHMPAAYPYRQYYLGIYDFWHESTVLDNELAVSRDGFHFIRVANGQKLIPLGAPGEWDAALVSKAHTLVPVGDQILLYYAGTRFSGVEGHPYDHFLRAHTGLARVPLDGWSYLRVGLEHDKGQATTAPIDLAGKGGLDLVIKADHLKPGTDFIVAELLDAVTGQPIPGFSAQDCEPIETDGAAIGVKWQGGGLGEAGEARVKVRFHLHGDETRLYCFGFE